MDEAVWRLHQLGRHHAPIASLDADCQVQANYFAALEQLFYGHGDCKACSIYYEHQLDADTAPRTRLAIAQYELHLRYYVHALRHAGYPYAVQTIGSCMAVRSLVYQQQGGMNRRQAGEDFYFLNKIVRHGGFYELSGTTVYPSSRTSGRVPFGTGRAMARLHGQQHPCMPSYNLNSFNDLARLCNAVPRFCHLDGDRLSATLNLLPVSVAAFLLKNRFSARLEELRHNSASPDTFRKRFFNWFDGFLVLKFVHYCRDHYYPDVAVNIAAAELLRKLDRQCSGTENSMRLLELYRQLDRRTTAPMLR
jgi:hypothetical protein